MVRKQIDRLHSQMRTIHPIRAVDKKLLGRELLDILGDLAHPRHRHVHVAKDGPTELVAVLIGEDGRVVGIAEIRIGVDMREERVNVRFERGNDIGVGVELLDLRGGRVGGLGEVEAGPAEEVVFSAVVIVLCVLLA